MVSKAADKSSRSSTAAFLLESVLFQCCGRVMSTSWQFLSSHVGSVLSWQKAADDFLVNLATSCSVRVSNVSIMEAQVYSMGGISGDGCIELNLSLIICILLWKKIIETLNHVIFRAIINRKKLLCFDTRPYLQHWKQFSDLHCILKFYHCNIEIY